MYRRTYKKHRNPQSKTEKRRAQIGRRKAVRKGDTDFFMIDGTLLIPADGEAAFAEDEDELPAFEDE